MQLSKRREHARHGLVREVVALCMWRQHMDNVNVNVVGKTHRLCLYQDSHHVTSNCFLTFCKTYLHHLALTDGEVDVQQRIMTSERVCRRRQGLVGEHPQRCLCANRDQQRVVWRRWENALMIFFLASVFIVCVCVCMLSALTFTTDNARVALIA